MKKRSWIASLSNILVIWPVTDNLAWYTKLLVFVAIAQALLFLWQLGYMRQGVIDAGKAADATKSNAQIARATLDKTFRPKVRVRLVLIREIMETGRVNITFAIGNMGDSDAFVRLVNAGIHWDDASLPTLPEEGPNPPIGVPTVDMAPGTSQVLTLETQEAGYRVLQSKLRKQHLFFLGFVRYTDDAQRIRETAFCRRYNTVTKRFVSVENPDYEHED